MEVGTPLGDLNYYKLNYQYQWLKPLSRSVSLLLNGEIGIGGGYDDKEMPLFRNFFAGGIGSVRGFDSGALGPKASQRGSNTFSIGGNKRIVGNAELLFPFPGMGNDRSVRLSTFLDIGGGRAGRQSGPLRKAFDLRHALFRWRGSHLVLADGPDQAFLANPLNAADDDEKQTFQFQLGNVF
jgi:outer membrane protein insertion porin family